MADPAFGPGPQSVDPPPGVIDDAGSSLKQLLAMLYAKQGMPPPVSPTLPPAPAAQEPPAPPPPITAIVGSGGQLHNASNGQFVSPGDPSVKVKRMRAAAARIMTGP